MIKITFESPVTVGTSTLSGIESEQVITTPLQIHVYPKNGDLKRLQVLGLSDEDKVLHQSWLDMVARNAKDEYENGAVTTRANEWIVAHDDQSDQGVDHSND